MSESQVVKGNDTPMSNGFDDSNRFLEERKQELFKKIFNQLAVIRQIAEEASSQIGWPLRHIAVIGQLADSVRLTTESALAAQEVYDEAVNKKR